jgi:hypothetical protein
LQLDIDKDDPLDPNTYDFHVSVDFRPDIDVRKLILKMITARTGVLAAQRASSGITSSPVMLHRERAHRKGVPVAYRGSLAGTVLELAMNFSDDVAWSRCCDATFRCNVLLGINNVST